jgi:hypothetical protein
LGEIGQLRLGGFDLLFQRELRCPIGADGVLASQRFQFLPQDVLGCLADQQRVLASGLVWQLHGFDEAACATRVCRDQVVAETLPLLTVQVLKVTLAEDGGDRGFHRSGERLR